MTKEEKRQVTERAKAIYADRQNRREHPDGTFDGGGRWYPSDTEQCPCCDKIRSPSRRWPYSLMLHCRSYGHIKHLVMREMGFKED